MLFAVARAAKFRMEAEADIAHDVAAVGNRAGFAVIGCCPEILILKLRTGNGNIVAVNGNDRIAVAADADGAGSRQIVLAAKKAAPAAEVVCLPVFAGWLG